MTSSITFEIAARWSKSSAISLSRCPLGAHLHQIQHVHLPIALDSHQTGHPAPLAPGAVVGNAPLGHGRIVRVEFDQDAIALQPVGHEPSGAGAIDQTLRLLREPRCSAFGI